MAIFKAYTKIPVEQKPYYYDYEKTDADIKKAFEKGMKAMEAFNGKLKKEIKNGTPSKLAIKK